MTFIPSRNAQIYYRNYRKIIDVIIQIGGFLNGTVYAATIILNIYSSNKILWQCIYNELKKRLNLKIIEKINKDPIHNRDNVVNVNRMMEEERKESPDQNNNIRKNENENSNQNLHLININDENKKYFLTS